MIRVKKLTCPYCNNTVEANADVESVFCPNCGAEIHNNKNDRSSVVYRVGNEGAENKGNSYHNRSAKSPEWGSPLQHSKNRKPGSKKLFPVILGACMVMIIAMLAGRDGNGSHEGEVMTPAKASDLKGDPYTDVWASFEESGFINVKTEKIEDLVFGWMTKDGEVEEVSVGGETQFKSGVWVPKDTEVVIRYHTFPEKEERKAEDLNEPLPEKKDKYKETETVIQKIY